MFDNIAPNYDNLNHILSFSIDKIWRRRVVKLVKRLKPQRVMDLATGTGDLAIKMAKRMPKIGGVFLQAESALCHGRSGCLHALEQ